MRHLLYFPHLLVVLLNCQSIDSNSAIFIDKEFTVYVKQFQIEASIRNVDVKIDYSIEFHDETIKDRLGVCEEWYQNGKKVFKKIKIDKKTWEKYPSYYDREYVLFHEMAHCSMNLNHTENNSSIMFKSKVMSTKYYIDNRQGLLNNLFIQKGE